MGGMTMSKDLKNPPSTEKDDSLRIGRRTALRRIALIGAGVTAACALLATGQEAIAGYGVNGDYTDSGGYGVSGDYTDKGGYGVSGSYTDSN